MIKHHLVLVTLVFVLVACSQAAPPVAASPSPPPIQPDAVVDTAKPYLDWFRQNRDDGTYVDFGFTDLEELDSATLGTPIEAYDLTSQAVEDYHPGQRLARLIIPAHRWEVPVLVNGEGRTLISVAYENGQWQPVGIGGAADQLVKLQQEVAQTTTTIKLVGTPTLLARSLALVEQGDQESLVILRRMGYAEEPFRALDAKAFDPQPPEAVMPLIKDVLLK